MNAISRHVVCAPERTPNLQIHDRTLAHGFSRDLSQCRDAGRVPIEFARKLIERDGPALGLDGMSEIVREGLRLVHRMAREQRAAAELEEYHGVVAPLPTGP